LIKKVSIKTAGKLDKNVSIKTTGKLDKNLSIKTTGKLDKNVSIKTAEKLDKNVSIKPAGKLDKKLSIKTAGKLDKKVASKTASKLNKKPARKTTQEKAIITTEKLDKVQIKKVIFTSRKIFYDFQSLNFIINYFDRFLTSLTIMAMESCLSLKLIELLFNSILTSQKTSLP
jgi:hypothetical protein